MGMTDPIADLLTRIRNGNMAGKSSVDAPFSKIKAEVVRILKAEGFIEDYTQTDRNLRIYLHIPKTENV
jgi:small subunit ribosomal protein S8